jgi:hypothetical protein
LTNSRDRGVHEGRERSIRAIIDKVENIVEKRLIGVDDPLKDELKAINLHNKLKRTGKAEYVPLKEALKSVGEVQGSSKKARR